MRWKWRSGMNASAPKLMDVEQRPDMQFPQSLPEFQRLFPNDEACAAYLERARWDRPGGCCKSEVGVAPLSR